MIATTPITYELEPVEIAEWHSSDLNGCARAVYHQHRGERLDECPTAMYRGLVFGEAAQLMHERNAWDEHGVMVVVKDALRNVDIMLRKEGRPKTASVEENASMIGSEVKRALVAYGARFGDRFSRCKLIGCELPMRLNVGGFDFASHYDLLIRDPDNVWGKGENRLIWADWKWRDSVPTDGYLARFPQFVLYQLGIHEGHVLIDGHWVGFTDRRTGEQAWPAAAWIHGPNLKPYGRATKSKDDDGDTIQFQKGDDRPEYKIINWVNFRQDRLDLMRHIVTERPRLASAGFWPASPDADKCRFCASSYYCDRADHPKIEQGASDAA